MYNGIGLQTPKGSGTNGYVQRNLSHLRAQRLDFKGLNKSLKAKDVIKVKRANPELLLHEQKRKVELELLKLESELEAAGLEEGEIQETIQHKREEMIRAVEEGTLHYKSELEKKDTHHLALEKEKKNERFERACQIDRSTHVTGQAFDQERQAQLKRDRVEIRAEQEKMRLEMATKVARAQKKEQKGLQKEMKESIKKKAKKKKKCADSSSISSSTSSSTLTSTSPSDSSDPSEDVCSSTDRKKAEKKASAKQDHEDHETREVDKCKKQRNVMEKQGRQPAREEGKRQVEEDPHENQAKPKHHDRTRQSGHDGCNLPQEKGYRRKEILGTRIPQNTCDSSVSISSKPSHALERNAHDTVDCFSGAHGDAHNYDSDHKTTMKDNKRKMSDGVDTRRQWKGHDGYVGGENQKTRDRSRSRCLTDGNTHKKTRIGRHCRARATLEDEDASQRIEVPHVVKNVQKEMKYHKHDFVRTEFPAIVEQVHIQEKEVVSELDPCAVANFRSGECTRQQLSTMLNDVKSDDDLKNDLVVGLKMPVGALKANSKKKNKRKTLQTDAADETQRVNATRSAAKREERVQQVNNDVPGSSRVGNERPESIVGSQVRIHEISKPVRKRTPHCSEAGMVDEPNDEAKYPKASKTEVGDVTNAISPEGKRFNRSNHQTAPGSKTDVRRCKKFMHERVDDNQAQDALTEQVQKRQGMKTAEDNLHVRIKKGYAGVLASKSREGKVYRQQRHTDNVAFEGPHKDTEKGLDAKGNKGERTKQCPRHATKYERSTQNSRQEVHRASLVSVERKSSRNTHGRRDRISSNAGHRRQCHRDRSTCSARTRFSSSSKFSSNSSSEDSSSSDSESGSDSRRSTSTDESLIYRRKGRFSPQPRERK